MMLNKQFLNKKRKQRQLSKRDEKLKKLKERAVGSSPLLLATKPTKGYKYFSDYIVIDDGKGSGGKAYQSVRTLLVDYPIVHNSLPGMWGTQLINFSLPQGVTMLQDVSIQNIGDKNDKKVRDMIQKTEHTVGLEASDDKASHERYTTVQSFREDLWQIEQDLVRGGNSYYHVAIKMTLTAPTLALLDEAWDDVDRTFKNLWRGGLRWVTYEGQQYAEQSNLYRKSDDQVGHGLYFTNNELAGSYHLLSHGLNDPTGIYCGMLRGDFDQSAIIWDLDKFDDHVVMAYNGLLTTYNHFEKCLPRETAATTVWGTQLVESALADGHRVVQIVLDDSNLKETECDLSPITTEIKMDEGSINPFQMFGDIENYNPSSVMSAHTEMLRQMAKQLAPSLDDIALNKTLSKAIVQFYVSMHMWFNNPEKNRSRIRIVGLANDDYPRLRSFVTYLSSLRTSAEKQGDRKEADRLESLEAVFLRMLNEDDDIFGQYTSDVLNTLNQSVRLVYDFRNLIQRGSDIAMAQLINAFNFALYWLNDSQFGSRGDLIVIHGAENLSSSIADYMNNQLMWMRKRGIRIAWLYNDTDAMLQHVDVNHLESADWILTGKLNKTQVHRYEDVVKVHMPAQFVGSDESQNDGLLQRFAPTSYFLHRGFENILFDAFLQTKMPAQLPVDFDEIDE